MLTDKELEEIRRKLLELEQEPPADGWKSIKAEIQPSGSNRRPFIWWFGGLLLLLLTGLGTYSILTNKPEEEPVATTATQPSQRKQPAGGATTEPPKQQNAASTGQTNSSAATQEQQLNDNEDTTTPKPAEAAEPLSAAEPAAAPQPSQPAAATVGKPASKPTQPIAKGIKPTAAPTDTLAKEKPRKPLTTEPYISAAPDTVQRKTVVPTEVPLPSINRAAPDSSSTMAEKELLATQIAAADSAAIAVAPDSGAAEEVAREKPKKEKVSLSNPSGWAVGAYFAPRYSFRKFTPNAEDAVLITKLNNNSRLDPERMGYEMGLNVSKALKPNISVESGFSLVKLRENVDYSYTIGEVSGSVMRQAPDGSIVIDAIQVTEDRQLVSSYTYGGFRLGINYYFLQSQQSRLNLTFAGGANLLLKGKTKEYRNGEWVETIYFPSKENILEQSNYNLLVGVGYNMALHPMYELTVMPALNYFLGSTFKEREPFGLRPYTLGVNLQLRRIL